MMRRSGLALAVLAVLAIGSMGAQTSRRTIPMSGTVVNAQGIPLAGATVALLRLSTFARGGEAHGIVAQGVTDQQGAFSLGSVALETEMAFPLETGLRFEYSVGQAGVRSEVAGVTFTAPRDGGSIASVAARITLK